MTDEIDLTTQWTTAARETYSARAEELITALREHMTLTLSHSGRQAEVAHYFPSSARLHQAAAAFDEAEFAWCGSFPLGLDARSWDDEGTEDEDQGEGSILTVVGRWDYRIVDESALISAGRAAYARVWVDDTVEDASFAVADSSAAAREIAHADGWHALEQAGGLEPMASSQTVIVHEEDGHSWFDSDEDPFAIVRND